MGQGLFAIGLIFVFIAIPCLFSFVLWKNRENLNTLSMRNKIGTIYPGIVTDNDFALSYSIVYLVRRSLFCMFTFAMYEVPGLQVQLFSASSVAYMIYLNSTQFFETKLLFTQEIVNEYMFLLICYHLVLFSNLIEDYKMLTYLGTSLASTCALMLAINLLIIMLVNFSLLKQKCR